MHLCGCLESRKYGIPGAGIQLAVGGLTMGAGTWTEVLCKSSKCSNKPSLQLKNLEILKGKLSLFWEDEVWKGT